MGTDVGELLYYFFMPDNYLWVGPYNVPKIFWTYLKISNLQETQWNRNRMKLDT